MKIVVILLFAACLLSCLPQDAYAYLDPGTGSVLLSVVFALVSSAYFALRKFPDWLRSVLFKARGKTAKISQHIVFYSESPAYWNTFFPLLEELGRRKVSALYLTSSQEDPVFFANLPSCIEARYIGQGNEAYMTLNFLKADICVLTTPGIDVLQIRRSKGVGKYVHVVHSIVDIHFYKYFSFDYYDMVICSGTYQAISLRALERVRQTPAKALPVRGCPYMDVFAKRCASISNKAHDKDCVLLAPTWGKKSVLASIGESVLKILLEAGFTVIFRPHPQSYVSEKERMEHLQQKFANTPNLVWDRAPDGFESMRRASVLVSDLSGIIFDFAFGFLRPVVTLASSPAPAGFEAFDLSHPLWELGVLDDLGKRVQADDADLLPQIVRQLQRAPQMTARLERIRAESVANYGCAAAPIVDEILSLNTGQLGQR